MVMSPLVLSLLLLEVCACHNSRKDPTPSLMVFFCLTAKLLNNVQRTCLVLVAAVDIVLLLVPPIALFPLDVNVIICVLVSRTIKEVETSQKAFK